MRLLKCALLLLLLPLVADAQTRINALPSGSAITAPNLTLCDQSGNTYTCTFTQVSAFVNANLPAASVPLAGTTTSIGGGALTAGACTTGTVAVTSASTGMAVAVSPVTDPGTSITWEGFVSSAGTVTVRVCALIAATPTAVAYNVRVLQ
jgi:hypothetical protein